MFFTIGLNGMSRAPKGDTVLRPFDEIFSIEVGIEGFSEYI